MQKKRIYLALGSNLGDKKTYLNRAILFLKENVAISKVAPMYESHPVGYQEQDAFYNTVLEGETFLEPFGLYLFVKKIEKTLGRVERFKNGPRELDIDILLFNQEVIELPELVIPHPRMHLRDFVLRPLVDIAPNIIHPILGKSMKELYQQLPLENRVIFNSISQ